MTVIETVNIHDKTVNNNVSVYFSPCTGYSKLSSLFSMYISNLIDFLEIRKKSMVVVCNSIIFNSLIAHCGSLW